MLMLKKRTSFFNFPVGAETVSANNSRPVSRFGIARADYVHVPGDVHLSASCVIPCFPPLGLFI